MNNSLNSYFEWIFFLVSFCISKWCYQWHCWKRQIFILLLLLLCYFAAFHSVRAYLFILYIVYIIAQFYSIVYFYKSVSMCFYCVKLLVFKQWKCLKGDTFLNFNILYFLYWIYIYTQFTLISFFVIFFFFLKLQYTDTLVLWGLSHLSYSSAS